MTPARSGPPSDRRPPAPDVERLAIERDRWYPFPPGTVVGLRVIADPRRPSEVIRTIPVAARHLRADRALVYSAGYVGPGTVVLFPLETIDGESLLLTATIEACQMVGAREHKTHVRFSQPITPEDFVVCWGLSVGDEGYCEPGAGRDAGSRGPGPDRETDARRRLAELGERLARAARCGDDAGHIRSIAELIVDEASALGGPGRGG